MARQGRCKHFWGYPNTRGEVECLWCYARKPAPEPKAAGGGDSDGESLPALPR